jgi:hypothetical protein
MEMKTLICPLCRAQAAGELLSHNCRDYLRCGVCSLVFVPAAQHLSTVDEKKRYDLHRNAVGDEGYRRFLSRLFLPLQQRLVPGSSGLDFGSGPAPTLSRMFVEAGHSMTLYDLCYEKVLAALDKQYDFITASEVAEHLREPRKELDGLWACLKRGGWLGIMTKFAVDRAAFSSWYYKDDPTHICFFSRETVTWLAAAWNAELIIPEDGVALFRKEQEPARYEHTPCSLPGSLPGRGQ